MFKKLWILLLALVSARSLPHRFNGLALQLQYSSVPVQTAHARSWPDKTGPRKPISVC
jgi:hypothetical protein